jgi:hypothetical protein
MESATVRFAESARVLTEATRAVGLGAPGFRCPPRHPDLDRCLRGRGEHAVVSVRLRGRPWGAVLADLVEGVVVANELDGRAAGRLRAALWAALDAAGLATPETPVSAGPPARPPAPVPLSRRAA